MSNNKPLKIACIGEAMIELSFVPGESRQATIGFAGDTLNTAIYMHRALSHQHKVSFLSRIGCDALSDQMREFIASEGVDIQHLQSDDEKLPGIYSISTDSSGERSFSYWRNDSAARRLFQVHGKTDFSILDQFDVLYLSGITLAILPNSVREALLAWLPSFRAKENGLVVFDSNYRAKLWEDQATAQTCTEKMWRLTDIGLPSVDDEMVLFEDNDEDSVLRRFQHYGIKNGVLKRGSQGPMTFSHELQVAEFSPAESMIDSTAAGDSFNGALLASLLQGNDIHTAMREGHDCACQVVGHRGAIIPK